MGVWRRVCAVAAAAVCAWVAAAAVAAAVAGPAAAVPPGPPVVAGAFSAEEDAAWLPALEAAEIVACRPFDADDAYADKFVVRLADGRQALLKLVRKHTLLPRALRAARWDGAAAAAGAARAEGGAYQGMPELAAWHVDRALGLYRKPPIAGRWVSSALLYPWPLAWLLPAYAVPVTLHAWLDGLRTADPPAALAAVVAGLAPPADAAARALAAQVGDVLALDFLVDDHDRAAEKNWVLRAAAYLQWDNGLGWAHGPDGGEGCLDILCGTNRWRRAGPQRCRRACVFSRATAEALAAAGPAAPPAARLAFRLREAMAAAPLADLFSFPLYYASAARDEVVRFPADAFFAGMDAKLERLLQHIDHCIALHGRDNVLV